MSAYIRVDSTHQLSTVVDRLNEYLTQNKSAKVVICEFKQNRSLTSNALYWTWLDQLASKFSQFSKDDMHDVMRHKFLGYTSEKSIGKTTIAPQLKSTKALNSSEFNFYLEQIDAWAAGLGILLKKPPSEYSEFLDEQEI